MPVVGALAASARSWTIAPAASANARRPTSAAAPRERKAGREFCENGPSLVKKVFRSGAARCRSFSSGVCASVSWPSRTMFVCSSERNVGKRWMPPAIAPRRVAEISAAREA